MGEVCGCLLQGMLDGLLPDLTVCCPTDKDGCCTHSRINLATLHAKHHAELKKRQAEQLEEFPEWPEQEQQKKLQLEEHQKVQLRFEGEGRAGVLL